MLAHILQSTFNRIFVEHVSDLFFVFDTILTSLVGLGHMSEPWKHRVSSATQCTASVRPAATTNGCTSHRSEKT